MAINETERKICMKRVFALFLSCVLLLGCLALPASAEKNTLHAGDTVFFGHYEQDNNTGNGAERIEWIVLEATDKYALLISKYCLDAASYHGTKQSVTWETSDLRAWLNDDFLYSAFSSAERKKILYTVNSTPKSAYGNKTGGNDTMDRVFCLSIDEANSYFKDNASRKASLTKYAASHTVYVWWWLRSPGGANDAAKAIINADGQVCTGGNWVTNNDAVRPCIVVDLTPEAAPTEAPKASAKENQAASAQALLDSGKYLQAMQAFTALGDQEKAQTAKDKYLASQRTVLAAGDYHVIGLLKDGTAVAAGSKEAGKDVGQCNVGSWTNVVSVSSGGGHSVGLREDGTVVTAGYSGFGQRNVGDWKNMVAVSAGQYHTVGLHSDGTVAAVGKDEDGQCGVSGWKNIVAVSAGFGHTVGLQRDGAVVATGWNTFSQSNVSSWKNIVAVAAGYGHTAGLCSDGTVVVAGNNTYSQGETGSWKNITAVAAGFVHTVGLRSDGTVVATGFNDNGQCNVSSWKNVVAIAAGSQCTIGLQSDGTILIAGTIPANISGWGALRTPQK